MTDSENIEIPVAGSIGTSCSVRGNAPQLTLAQGNVRPVTQVSGTGGTANNPPPVALDRSSAFQRDNSHMTTLTELGKKLVAAAKVGNTSQVRRLMAIGAPFASDGPIGMTPLHLAAQNGHYETCDRLLCAGMNINARNKVDKTPLHLAAMEGHYDIASLLVKTGANVNACDMLKMTPLHWACDRGHTQIVRLLLKSYGQTDVTNKFSKTPLHLAVENGYENIVLLLQKGICCKEEEEAVAVESISLDITHDLDSIPVVCKTEEVHTEELLVEEVCENSQSTKESSQSCKEGEDISSVDSELPHSIMADDTDAALELLKAQAALLPIDDASTLVTSAVAHGQTLHLTEAGRQALKFIKQELPLLPSNPLLQEPPSGIDQDKTNKKSSNSITNAKRRDKTSSSHVTVQSSSCLPALLPSSSIESVDDDDGEEVQQVTQKIQLSAFITITWNSSCIHGDIFFQHFLLNSRFIIYSGKFDTAIIGGTNGPIILQVLPASADEEHLNEINKNQSPPATKRQKVMQLVTRVGQGSSGLNQAVAKVSGEVLSVDLPNYFTSLAIDV
ncbi:GA-binding protein subunit beta-1-like [Homarus americanus]|uniref:GA-binding protein subunit beta-1-like n=1 Tax=Homarus americanus TaxID=6706 RepID=A0A8J5MRF0_HOMAM|nr:GA-binding protein subunit beta-1-like [Homarus americanus]